MKFRKKPIEIDAVLWDGSKEAAAEIFKLGESKHLDIFDDGAIQIATLEGTMRCDKGDWVIRGIKGELYPCKPDIFELTYEPSALSKNGMVNVDFVEENCCQCKITFWFTKKHLVFLKSKILILLPQRPSNTT
jgi:hypothetical protein